MRYELDIINKWKQSETTAKQDIDFMMEYLEIAGYESQTSTFKRLHLEVLERIISEKKQWIKDQYGFHTTFKQDNMEIELDYEAPFIIKKLYI